MSVIKFETKEVVYTANGAKVIQAKSKITGRIIKRAIGQAIHDKMIATARNVKQYFNKNNFKANLWKEQLKTHFKSYGFNVACVTDVVLARHGLTLNTFMNLA